MREQNFLVANDVNQVNNAVLRFRRQHPFLRFMLEQLVSNFMPTVWGNQGWMDASSFTIMSTQNLSSPFQCFTALT